ncbi:MAG: FAD-dependent oxidoreductase [Phycisphaerae bacterium]
MAAPGPILIFGGGIAGLYTRALLASRGRDVVLVERSMLGDGQTVASQGILHRGVKYALSRKAARAADSLERSLKAWDDHFAGRGCVDLRGLPLAATRMHLWTRPGGMGSMMGSIMGSLTGMAASLAMKSGVRRLAREEFPAALTGSPEGVAAWEVEERCVDVRALLATLRDVEAGPIIIDGEADPARLAARFDASAVVLAAGSGNESLLTGLGVDPSTWCQRRPLHMAVMRGALFDVNGHCLQELSDKPRLTITTTRSGLDRVWYIGGDVAERGVALDEQSQVRATMAELESCIGWADLRGGRWSTLRIDRAEGRSEDGSRPDGPVCRFVEAAASRTPTWVAWPTKLALAPALAAMVAEALDHAGIPAAKRSLATTNHDAPVAPLPWEPAASASLPAR